MSELQNLQAVQGGEYLFFASCTLVLYDHLITFDQEIAYFWSSKWAISSILYMASRYLADTEVLLIFAMYVGKPTFVSCERLQIAVYTVAALEMAVNQGVISLRVWHLFTHNSIIRGAVTIIYLVCIVAIVVFLFMSLGLAPTSQEGCGAMLHIAIFWRVYLPAVILHSVLYLFTVLRTLGSTWRGMSGIGRRFISEGGPMYLVATCSLLYSLIASKLIDEPEAYIPAIESYFSQSMVSIAVCHAMLSIRTLAARYDVDPTWLLSHAELSRLRWKRGPDGEVVVDCEFLPDDGNVELAQLPSVAQPKVAHPTSRPSTGASFMST